MKILGLITARGGSKGIPLKNIRIVGNKPLIFWTIQAAQQAKTLDRIILSTDDTEIAQVARDHHVEVPFMRPAALAGDASSHIDVIIHALSWVADNEDYHPDYVLTLQPTSPLRTAEDIDRAVELAMQTDAASVVSVYEAPSHPYIVKKLTPERRLENFITPDMPYLRRQDFPEAYALNGALYLNRCKTLLVEKQLVTDETLAYIMSVERSLDVDTTWDLYLADLVLTNRQKNAFFETDDGDQEIGSC